MGGAYLRRHGIVCLHFSAIVSMRDFAVALLFPDKAIERQQTYETRLTRSIDAETHLDVLHVSREQKYRKPDL